MNYYKQNDKSVQDLRAQARATREIASASEDGDAQELAFDGAATLDSIASKREAKEPPGTIAFLPYTASMTELSEMRQRRSVLHGQSVYLPVWRNDSIVFPNLLLRSSLFSSSNPGPMLKNEPIAVQGDASIIMTGHQLCDYDRRVLAVCLKHYRDQKLADATGPKWIETTFWKFAKDLGVSYGAQVHKAIQSSLIRLSEVVLRVRLERYDLQVGRLIEVRFESSSEENVRPRGGGVIVFRVFDSMARLYGLAKWTAVSEKALHNYSGLASWIVSFYNTHSKPYPITMGNLYKLSGSKGEMFAFRRRLKQALSKLQNADVPDNIRISRVDIDGEKVMVYLARWSQILEKVESDKN